MEQFSHFLISLAIIVVAISIHEFAHAYFADLAGDPTPRSQGRVTLNPVAHFDPVGFMMIVVTSWTGYGIGWGRPVMVDTRRMRNPRWDHFVSVAAGPLSNVAQAVFYALMFRLGAAFRLEWLMLIGGYGAIINLGLAAFNLIPIGPLDGHWMIGAFLPERTRIAWYQFNRSVGMVLFLLLIIFPAPLKLFLWPMVERALYLLIGYKGVS